MFKYQVTGNRIAIVTIYIDIYMIILDLIKRELQCLDFDNNKKIRLKLIHIKF